MLRDRALLVALVCAWLLLPRDALAYIDVGAGSVMLQAAIASFLGFLYLARMRWAGLKARLLRRKVDPPSDATGSREENR